MHWYVNNLYRLIHVSLICFTAAAVTCSSLVVPANSMITYVTDTSSPFDYQTTATYSCVAGFGLFGGDTMRACVKSSSGPGDWSGTAPICEGVVSISLLT